MSYLIDTCCISELVRKKPDPNVVKWFADQDELSIFISVLTFGELRKGIEKLPDSKKKDKLNLWVSTDLKQRFKNRILNIHMKEVDRWGRVLAMAEKRGRPLSSVDSLIAATALEHNLFVVTRNTQDMEGYGADVINPWNYNPTSKEKMMLIIDTSATEF